MSTQVSTHYTTAWALSNAAPLTCLSPPFIHLRLHQFVTLAGRFFELCPIYNLDVAASVGDQAGLLKHPSCNADAGTSGTEHLPQKFLRQGHGVGSDAIGAHQQPARQSLAHLMQTIAGCELRHLHGHDLRKLL